MSDAEVRIKYKVDNQTPGFAAQQVRQMNAIVAAADRAARAQGKAAADAAGRTAREAKRGADAAVKEADRAAKAQVVSINSVIVSGLKLQDRLEAATRKAAESQIRANRRVADAQAREARRATDAAAREADKLSKAQEKAAARATKVAQQAAEAQAESLSIGGQAAEQFVGSLKQVALGFVGIQSASKLMDAVGSSFAAAKAQALEFGAETLKLKGTLGELATLRGLAFADDEFVKKMAGFGRQTGMTLAQADTFQRAVLGSAAGGMQKGNIDEATLDAVMVEAGRTAVRQKADMNARGDLIGLLPQFKAYAKGEAGMKDLLGDAEAVRLGLTEGRGDDAPLTRSFAAVAGSLISDGGKGMLPSAPELAALIGVTSLTAGPLGADTRAEQLIRGVRGGTAKQIGFMKDTFGIDEHDNLEKRLDKVIPKLREMEKGGRDIPTYLTESGLPEEQVKAIVEMMPNLEMFKGRLGKARAPGQGEAVIAANKKFFEHETLGRETMGRAEAEANRAEAGLPLQEAVSEVERQRAKAVPESMMPGYHLGNMMYRATTGGFVEGEQVRLEQRAIDDLKRRTGGIAPVTDVVDQVPLPGAAWMPSFMKRGLISLMGGSAVDIQALRAQEEAIHAGAIPPMANIPVAPPAGTPAVDGGAGSGPMAGPGGGSRGMGGRGGNADVVGAIDRQTKVMERVERAVGPKLGPKVLPVGGNNGRMR